MAGPRAESFTVSPLHVGSYWLGTGDLFVTAETKHLARGSHRYLRRLCQSQHGLHDELAGVRFLMTLFTSGSLVAWESGASGR